MRLSLKRSLTWVVALVLLQLVVYYWSLKRPRRLPPKLTLPRYTQTHPSNEGTCSFKTCPAVKEGYLNVHIVPHSHTDVGWLKTVDQYYTGEIPADIGQELGCVRCTLESTIRELEKNKDRRFVFIEMKYFSRYWNEIKDSERELIRTLIRERRLELVGGGWVMSDAGVTMYNDIIDQHTLGFDFIADTFGPCAQTRTGWHVDQFGHSREHASIFAQMGFDSLFVSRIDFEDLAERKRTKNMEFVWYTSPLNLRNRSSLFTQVTYDGYYAPNGYVFDSGSSSSLKVSELDAVHFLKIIKLRAQSYKSKHILVPMGSDFGYKNAETWFQYLDPLIKAANEIGSPGFQMNFLYSTPSCYTYYVNKEKLTYEVKKDDFLPYSVPPSAFWTGYYTTRGGFKKFIKLAGQILQACKQISIFMDLTDSFYHVNALRDAMGIMQHHDAVTGTQKKHVLKDYCQLLSNGTHECQYVLSQAYRKFWGVSDSDVPYVTSQFCPDLNISSCHVTEGRSQFLVTLYNTLSWPVSIDVRFPVQFKQMTVTNWNGDDVPYQIVPVHEHIQRIPERVSNVDSELVMLTTLPPMSISTFVVKPHEDEVATVQYEDNYGLNKHLVIENEHLSLTFDTSSGLLVRMTNKDSALTESVSQDFNYYEAQQDIHRFSGAYVFIPKHPATIRVSGEKKVNLRLVKGPLVQEIHQTFSPWVSQVVRLYKGSKHAEFQWTVGPIDDSDRQGKEVISIFTTSIVNSDTFYTDSNGRELMERV
nr:lysosomal alpha-mannosidase-like [Biomphalaria glabrata]